MCQPLPSVCAERFSKGACLECALQGVPLTGFRVAGSAKMQAEASWGCVACRGCPHGHVPTSGIRPGSGVDVPDASEIALRGTQCMAARLHLFTSIDASSFLWFCF